MRLKTILSTLTVACGVFLMVGSAHAQILNILAQPQSIGGATGTYDVVLHEVTSTEFTYTVTGDNDGTMSGPGEKTDARQVAITFVGDTIASSPVSTGAVGGTPWSESASGPTVTYQTPTSTAFINAFGGNDLAGTIFLTNPFSSGQVGAAVTDELQQWNGIGNLTPEAGSMMLMLPALLPLLLMVRKRKTTNSGQWAM